MLILKKPVNGGVFMRDDLFDEEDLLEEDEEEYLLDEVSGRKRKSVMSILNKTKLSRYEMDDLFID